MTLDYFYGQSGELFSYYQNKTNHDFARGSPKAG